MNALGQVGIPRYKIQPTKPESPECRYFIETNI